MLLDNTDKTRPITGIGDKFRGYIHQLQWNGSHGKIKKDFYIDVKKNPFPKTVPTGGKFVASAPALLLTLLELEETIDPPDGVNPAPDGMAWMKVKDAESGVASGSVFLPFSFPLYLLPSSPFLRMCAGIAAVLTAFSICTRNTGQWYVSRATLVSKAAKYCEEHFMNPHLDVDGKCAAWRRVNNLVSLKYVHTRMKAKQPHYGLTEVGRNTNNRTEMGAGTEAPRRSVCVCLSACLSVCVRVRMGASVRVLP